LPNSVHQKIKELAERRARDINTAYEEIRKRRQQP